MAVPNQPQAIPPDIHLAEDPRAGGGPGARYATKANIVVVSAVSILLTLLVFYLLLALWPHPTPAMVAPYAEQGDTAAPAQPARDTARADTVPGDTAGADTTAGPPPPAGSTGGTGTTAARQPRSGATQMVPGYLWCDTASQRAWAAAYPGVKPGPEQAKLDPKCVSVLGYDFPMWDEKRLLALVMLAGVLGGMVHVLRSIGWYVGNRMLVRSWLPRYFLLPLTGAALGALIYVVIRGQFFASNAPTEATSPFGFVAIAALAGLFSEQAVLKLKDVMDSVLTRPKEGANPAPPQTPPGSASGGGGGAGKAGGTAAGGLSVTGSARLPGGGGTQLVIDGTGFAPGTTVHVDGAEHAARIESETRIVVQLSADEAAEILDVKLERPDQATVSFQSHP